MKGITVRDIVEATNGRLLCGDDSTVVEDICIDSREIKAGDLFVPIIGQKVDAHTYIESVLEIGAASLTSEHDSLDMRKPCIRVENTEEALKMIGRYVRARIDLPIVAVTGSVGKTTTRNMIATALRSQYRVCETIKNYNSQIGVPIMICKIQPEDDMAVLECGMSEPGQIHTLSELVKPRYAVVSVIGVAHIENLKTQENIRDEKLSIIDALDPNGVLFLNGDDAMLAGQKGKLPVKTIYYGTEDWCDYYAADIQYDHGRSYFTCVHGEKRIPVELSVLGRHNILNCIGALAVADTQGIPMEKAAEVFAHYSGIRQKIIELENRFRVIDDTYNASPDSMRASLDVLCHVETTGRRVAVLGDMFELGENSEQYHYQVGEYLSSLPVDELIVVGDHARMIRKAVEDSGKKMKLCSFMENEEVAMYLIATLQPDDIVLLKGSNGMKMWEILEVLQQ
ncbi:MAG: UDP-N-acetylmuramoyl-tripeptide--D-alanyl-D-alanine ligase [Lachnospiraceae bacterium]|nr:UDP-N-acetylmuramoyl-tripeptide--D-alanyl-D-alanine ligase [Lachnospiraceae bacterium]